MAESIRIVINHDGFRELLCSDEMHDLVQEHAEAVAQRAGDGFEATTFMGGFGGGRWVGNVKTISTEARKAEAENMVLSQAVNG